MAKDPYRYFRIEAREIVDGLAQGVLELEKGAPPREVIARLLRHAHTLKGAARVVKQIRLAELSHAVEEILSPHREPGTAPAPSEITRLLALTDEMERHLEALQGASVAAPESQPGTPSAPAPSPPVVDDRLESIRVTVRELEALRLAASETGVTVRAIHRHARALEDVARSAAQLAQALALRAEPLAENAQELKARLALLGSDLVQTLERTERSVAVLEERADRLRLVPASAIFPTIERAVRDAAVVSEREVDFTATGGESRLDGEVLSSMREALLHLARNAVVHGIEPGPARVAARKPARGRIELRVERLGGQVVFRFADDGRGLDLVSIGRIAVSRGLITPEVATGLTVPGAVAVLLRGGVSTSQTVNEIAGRGVGLDVVRDVAVRLKGTVDVASEPGLGTSVTLKVPVSLSAIGSLVVEADSTTCSLPLDTIVRALRLDDANVVRAGGRESIIEDGVAIPFAPLGELVGVAGAASRTRRSWSALIVRAGEDRVALGADRVLGVESVVVRALPAVVGVLPAVSGASLDDQGNPRLALDASGLAEAARRRSRHGAVNAPTRRAPILVIDDSLTTRMLEQSILESAGYEVELATSAEQGLEKARLQHYGVFVVDVEMPGMDGFEFVTRTRADADLSKTPAILVTSRGAPEDKRRGVEAGAYAYIVKGEFDQGRLLTAIRELIG